MYQRTVSLLEKLYGSQVAPALISRLEQLLIQARRELPTQPKRQGFFDERDSFLITYGDMVQEESVAPLQTLGAFANKYLVGLVSGIHILPFFPYSSDDGFSVVDYASVDPQLGTWEHVENIGNNFRLMFDAVINHMSAQSEWFQRFLRGHPPYRDFFITADPTQDYSNVFRPRTSPLLTPVETSQGTEHVWTTFSPDQVDLNYRSPQLLLAIVEVLLTYVKHGAQLIRLDAVGFLWKEPGTSCIHLPQTHALIQLLRAILDEVAPGVALVTETNVPHAENITYFGDGSDEAQMVYNFSLPPLTLHAFHTGNAQTLTKWARTLTLPSDQVTYFNFLASHDGIGLTPARGILADEEIEQMAARTELLGGMVSYKSNSDGTQSPYELNINYLDALADPYEDEEPIERIARRFLTAQAIMLALQGVPGIYFHSLFGSRNWREGVEETGRARTINRQKLIRRELEQQLSRSGSLRSRVYRGYANLIWQRRQANGAFHPSARQTILSVHPSIFAVLRSATKGKSWALCLHNVSAFPHTVTIDLAAMDLFADSLHDRVSGATIFAGSPILASTVAPYQTMWLTPTDAAINNNFFNSESIYRRSPGG